MRIQHVCCYAISQNAGFSKEIEENLNVKGDYTLKTFMCVFDEVGCIMENCNATCETDDRVDITVLGVLFNESIKDRH